MSAIRVLSIFLVLLREAYSYTSAGFVLLSQASGRSLPYAYDWKLQTPAEGQVKSRTGSSPFIPRSAVVLNMG